MHTIWRIDSGDETVYAMTEEHREAELRRIYEGLSEEYSDVLEAYIDGDESHAKFLAIEEELLDPDDEDEVSGDLWGRWLTARLSKRGFWFEPHPTRKDAGVTVFIEDFDGTAQWPGGPVRVEAAHGEKGAIWVSCKSWGDVRRALIKARGIEDAALRRLDEAAATDRARFDDVRAAHKAVRDAERALEDARKARAALAQQHIASGDSVYRLAKELGLSQPAVAKWLGRS